MYALVNKAKTKFSQSKLVLSCVLRHRDKSWQHTDNRTLGVTFVDLNSWIENWDFGRDGLHINKSGVRRLSQLYSRVFGFGGGEPNLNEKLLLSTDSERTPESMWKTMTQEHPTLVWQMIRREKARANQTRREIEEVTSDKQVAMRGPRRYNLILRFCCR